MKKKTEGEVKKNRTDAEGTMRPGAQGEVRLAQALDDSRKFLQDVIDRIGLPVFVKDAQGRYVLSNEAHAEILMIPAGYALEKTDYDIHLREVADKVRGDDKKVLETGTPLKIEETLKIREQEHTLITTKTPLLDRNGKPYAVCGVVTDITEHKNLEAQLLQARKAEAIGILAGGIAHEFNNLLTVILMNVSLILVGFEPTHPHYSKLRSIEKMVRKGSKLTMQLLRYAREGIFRLRDRKIINITYHCLG